MEQPSGGRTGGVYIPPFKLAQLRKSQEENPDDPNNAENQKASWEALRKSINGLINKVNVANIKQIIPDLFQLNLIRGRGLFARAIMKAQLASPGFTPIYASLISVINTKLPENGELILKRIIYGFKRAYKRRDKITAGALAKFIAHLVNHQVAHELLALQLLTVLLEEPTDDSVEIGVGFVKEVGQLLQELSPQGLIAIFERFRGILHEGDIDKRVTYTIEGLFAIWKSDFKDFPAIPPELDLVEREDQITFDINFEDDIDKEEMLDIYRFDPKFAENEELYLEIKREILGDEEEEYEDGDADDESGEGDENHGEVVSYEIDKTKDINASQVIDLTEQDLVNLRRSIYLTIMSSVSYDECCHKLLKLNIPQGYEHELCNMLIECCANERSYLRYYGLMGQRFCMVHKKYQDAFDQTFQTQYETIHRLETNKLRNVAKFFAHLVSQDSLPWTVFAYIHLNEHDTTSSSRIFIKILIQDLAEFMGLQKLKERFSDEYMQDVFQFLFPRDNARNTRFAINFFTSIGLGGLTDGLREHLKNMPKILAAQLAAQQQAAAMLKAKVESSSSGSSSDSSSESDSDSDSSSESSSGSSSSSSYSSGSSSSDSSSSYSSSSSGSSSSSASDSDSSGSDSSSSSSSSGSSTASSAKLDRKRRKLSSIRKVDHKDTGIKRSLPSPPAVREISSQARELVHQKSSRSRDTTGRVANDKKRGRSSSRSPAKIHERAPGGRANGSARYSDDDSDISDSEVIQKRKIPRRNSPSTSSSRSRSSLPSLKKDNKSVAAKNEVQRPNLSRSVDKRESSRVADDERLLTKDDTNEKNFHKLPEERKAGRSHERLTVVEDNRKRDDYRRSNSRTRPTPSGSLSGTKRRSSSRDRTRVMNQSDRGKGRDRDRNRDDSRARQSSRNSEDRDLHRSRDDYKDRREGGRDSRNRDGYRRR